MVKQFRTGQRGQNSCPGAKLTTTCNPGERCTPPGLTWGRGMCTSPILWLDILSNPKLDISISISSWDRCLLSTAARPAGRQAGRPAGRNFGFFFIFQNVLKRVPRGLGGPGGPRGALGGPWEAPGGNFFSPPPPLLPLLALSWAGPISDIYSPWALGALVRVTPPNIAIYRTWRL